MRTNIALLVLFLGFPAAAQYPLDESRSPGVGCCTNFNDENLHGWGACPSPQNNVGVALGSPGPSGQASDIYLHVTDKSGGSLVCAGADCNGDWTEFILKTPCPTFCFDVRLDIDGAPNTLETIHPSFTIKSGTTSATFTANILMTEPGGSSSGWHHICAPIALATGNALPSNSTGAWSGTTPAGWNSLLTNVTAVTFPIDFTGNPAEELSYDNFCIRPGDCPPPAPLCSLCGEISGDCCLGIDAQGHKIYSFLAPITYQSFSTPPATCNLVLTPPPGVTIITYNPTVLNQTLTYVSGTFSFTGTPPSPFCFTAKCSGGESCITPICVRALPECAYTK